MNGTWSSVVTDSLNRVQSAQYIPVGSGTTTNFCWAYDGFGNRTAQVNNGTTGCPSTVPATMTYNANNQITWVQNSLPTGPTYDVAGNVIQDATNKYLYDAEGQVCATMNLAVGTMTGYIYDADGVRVAKGTISAWTCDIKSNGFQPVSDYIIGPGGEQLTETGSDGQGNMVWSHTNVFAAGTLIGTYDKDGLHFYLNDWLGNRRVQTDYAGVFEQSCTNLPYGDSLNCTESLDSPTEHHFTGKERDSESGNDYFGARYYASSMGRFLTPDWSAKIMPVPYAKMYDPQSLNLYGYVLNNPLFRTDLDGHVDCSGSNASGIGCQFLAAWNTARGIVSSAYDSTMKEDMDKFNNSTQVKLEAGFGLKAHLKFGPVDLHAGGTLHDEKSFAQQGENIVSAGPITDKLEYDYGATLGKFGLSKEKGLEHAGGDEAPIERYSEGTGTVETPHGGEVSGNGEQTSIGLTGYGIIGGGVTLSIDTKALLSVAKDVPSFAGEVVKQFLLQP